MQHQQQTATAAPSGQLVYPAGLASPVQCCAAAALLLLLLLQGLRRPHLLLLLLRLLVLYLSVRQASPRMHLIPAASSFEHAHCCAVLLQEQLVLH
jgi:hypothetical protein